MPNPERSSYRAKKTFKFLEKLGLKGRAGNVLLLEKPPSNIEEYKAILREVQAERRTVKEDLARVKGKQAKEELKERLSLLDKVILSAENKVAEYESKELGNKLREEAVEEFKEDVRDARSRHLQKHKEEHKKKVVQDLMSLVKKRKQDD